MFREVLRKVCEDLKHSVVGEAADGETAVELVGETRPDLVLLDLHLPKVDGFGVLEQIRAGQPDVGVLVLSSHCDDFTVYRAERAGVQGFVDKNSNSIDSLKAAIRAVEAGKPAFSEMFRQIQARRHKDPDAFDKVLGKREQTIVALVGQSLRDDEIARRLGISEQTVATHRLHAIRKLGLSGTTELVRYARDRGFTLAPPRNDDALLP